MLRLAATNQDTRTRTAHNAAAQDMNTTMRDGTRPPFCLPTAPPFIPFSPLNCELRFVSWAFCGSAAIQDTNEMWSGGVKPAPNKVRV